MQRGVDLWTAEIVLKIREEMIEEDKKDKKKIDSEKTSVEKTGKEIRLFSAVAFRGDGREVER